MIKYSDQDEKHLEKQIEKNKQREQDGEKVASERPPLERLLEQVKKGRQKED